MKEVKTNSPQQQKQDLGNFILDYYQRHAGRDFDLIWNSQTGQPITHWQKLFQTISQFSLTELDRRHSQAQRYLRENGVTYSGFSEEDKPRSWDLDIVPLVLAHDQWLEIEGALQQRAQLYNLIYQDIYSEQRLVKDGIIPSNLIFSHPGFLRPCFHDNKQQLNLSYFSSDIVWDQQGQMHVVKDSIDAPSGLGYTLENRIVMNRIMSDVFQHVHVHRLSPFFRIWRDALLPQQTHAHYNSNVVVLSAGPDEEGYFEHAYLATRLGYNLVQGNDLIVKDARLWLKSIEGLKPVDIIVRRIPSNLCDPLELDGASAFGVPGLLTAVRQGNVVISNPLGTSFLESPGLLPFLPRIAEYFGFPRLQLPSIKTWWCGQQEDFRYVQENLSNLIVRSTHDPALIIHGPSLKDKEKSDWQARIKAQPYHFVGQAIIEHASLPTMVNKEMQPYAAMLRTFLMSDGGNFQIMPGGLTKVAEDALDLLGPIGYTDIVKDTWVMLRENSSQARVWPALRQRRSNPSDETNEVLSSRAAENLFWVGRYIERGENTARLLRTVISRHHDFLEHEDESEKRCQHILLQGLTEMTQSLPGFLGEKAPEKLNNPLPELHELCSRHERTGSLVQVLNLFVQTTFVVRDFWTNDMWRIIDDIDEHIHAMTRLSDDINVMQTYLDQVVTAIMSFTGLMTESMPHEKGWFFLDIGRRIERGICQSTLLRHCLTTCEEEMVEHLLLEALLTNYESLMTHRRRFRDYQRVATALELLLLDKLSPRSLAYQIYTVEQIINELPRSQQRRSLLPEQKLILALSTHFKMSDANQLSTVNRSIAKRQNLDILLKETEEHLTKISDLINNHYFTHTESARQLGDLRFEVVS